MTFMIVSLKKSNPVGMKAIPETQIEGEWLSRDISSVLSSVHEDGFQVNIHILYLYVYILFIFFTSSSSSPPRLPPPHPILLHLLLPLPSPPPPPPPLPLSAAGAAAETLAPITTAPV